MRCQEGKKGENNRELNSERQRESVKAHTYFMHGTCTVTCGQCGNPDGNT